MKFEPLGRGPTPRAHHRDREARNSMATVIPTHEHLPPRPCVTRFDSGHTHTYVRPAQSARAGPELNSPLVTAEQPFSLEHGKYTYPQTVPLPPPPACFSQSPSSPGGRCACTSSSHLTKERCGGRCVCFGPPSEPPTRRWNRSGHTHDLSRLSGACRAHAAMPCSPDGIGLPSSGR